MQILELTPRRQFEKRLYDHEASLLMMITEAHAHAHMLGNPHQTAVGDIAGLQTIVNTFNAFIAWESKRVTAVGSSLIAGKITIVTGTQTRNERVYMDGLLMAEGTSFDYTITHWPGQTIIEFMDWGTISPSAVIQVVYEEMI